MTKRSARTMRRRLISRAGLAPPASLALLTCGAACWVTLSTSDELSFFCSSDSDCQDGYTCVESRCTPGSDSEADAGQPREDAGQTDAHVPDATGADTSAPDRRAADAAPIDAAAWDTGAGDVDAAAFDASAPEATTPDTGREDGAGADAGPRCDDLAHNGDETDVDCGGSFCLPCAEGLRCARAGDCETGYCPAGTCQPPELGSGADGAVTFSSDTRIDVDNTIAGRSCADGGDAVAYAVVGLSAASATLASPPTAGCLTAGDEVLLINLQGAPSADANTGSYEALRVQSVSDATVHFTTDKIHCYGDAAGADTGIGPGAGSQRVVLQRVPNYTIVAVEVGATLRTSAWNGGKGGIIFIRATDEVRVLGAISASLLGYRRGVAGATSPEGARGFSAVGGGGGGGGSGGHNGSNPCGAAGAGADGAQAGYCGVGGDQYNPCAGYASMCLTHGCGGDGVLGGGGGGAGYGYSDAVGGIGTAGGGDGGDKASNVGGDGSDGAAGCGGGGGGAGRDSGGGGGGGSPYRSEPNGSPSDLSRIVLGGGAAAGAGGGGGGGAGDYACAQGGGGGARTGVGGTAGADTCAAEDATAGEPGTDGAAGGGIVAIFGRDIAVTGSISSDGGQGGSGGPGGRGAAIGSCGTGCAAGGGGGGGGADGAAGGSILLWGYDISLGSDLVTAVGGAGGAGGAGGVGNGGAGGASSGNGGSGGAGAPGAPGAIAVRYRTSLSGTTRPEAFTAGD